MKKRQDEGRIKRGEYKKEREMLRGFLDFKAILKRYGDVFCLNGRFVCFLKLDAPCGLVFDFIFY